MRKKGYDKMQTKRGWGAMKCAKEGVGGGHISEGGLPTVRFLME